MSGTWSPFLLLGDEQRMLSKTVEQLVRRHAPAGRIRTFRDTHDAIGFSLSLWKEMAELGWLGLQIPEEHGGAGLGFFDLCILLEQAGRELMPEPLVSTLLLGTQALLLGGNEEHKSAMLPAVASGDLILCVALGDRWPGSGVTDSTIRARPMAGGYELSGELPHVLDAHLAHRILLSAATGEASETLFIVDSERAGVSVTRQHRVDGLNAGIVRLDRLVVTEADVVGEPNAGTELVERVLDRACIGLAAQMLGGAEQAFADTLAYLKQREQFDVPIGSFQALQHRAVSVFTELALTRAAVRAAARAVDESPKDVSRLASLAKTLASETFVLSAKEAIQMHGGIGVTDEHEIGLYLKRAQAGYVTFGRPSQHRQRWAELHGY